MALKPSSRATVRRTRPGARRLAVGDLIGVVAPGFAVQPAALRSGIAALQRMGYRVRRGPHVLSRHGYLAGTDEARAADLLEMIEDPEVRAVWFARGGFGTARLLARLPPAALRHSNKLYVGYSDMTALFVVLDELSAAPCLYGPLVAELGDAGAYHHASLAGALAGAAPEIRFRRARVLRPGRAVGQVAGGTLTVLAHLCGTPFAPRFGGRILLLEEIGEEAYRIDRALTQLAQAGVLDGVVGVVVGAMRVPARRRFPPDRRLVDVLQDHLGPLRVPVATGLPVGHCRAKRTLPLGVPAELDTTAGRLRFVS